MKYIDLNTWNRKAQYEHFIKLLDPYFAITVPCDVTKAYNFSKENNLSFFGKYLHDCMKAINDVDNLKLRIENNKIVEYPAIHASATIMRNDKTFGFSFIEFDSDLNTFIKNISNEKDRIENTNFTGHKEPISGNIESVPKIAFSKVTNIEEALNMNVSMSANHALVDGYHVGEFFEKFQNYLNL